MSEVLARRLTGRVIQHVKLAPQGGAIVARDLIGQGFSEGLRGAEVLGVRRRGKFLLFELAGGRWLAANPKLAGRFQLCPPGAKKAGPVIVTLAFLRPDEELRYADSKKMGQLYLTRDLSAIPTFGAMGPDAVEILWAEFQARIRCYRGEIKGILTRGEFIAGVGNAYADEILWNARIHPYRKRTSLQPEEVERLYQAMRTTLSETLPKVRAEMGDEIQREPRDFFSVHMRGGQACPRCGASISTITAQGRMTNFCRKCQPGGLLHGMSSLRAT